MPRRLQIRRKRVAPATIHFTSETNPEGKMQLCVFAQCHFSERVAGPVWGHQDVSIRRALAQLTNECDCPARFHKAREYSGMQIHGSSRPRQ